MSRVQLALNVSNLDQAIDFYSKFFKTPPAKVRPGYANFAIEQPPLKLVLIENTNYTGSLNHLGVEQGDAARRHRDVAGGSDAPFQVRPFPEQCARPVLGQPFPCSLDGNSYRNPSRRSRSLASGSRASACSLSLAFCGRRWRLSLPTRFRIRSRPSASR